MIARSLLIVCVSLLCGCGSITKAQEVRVVDGQKHLVHTVLKGQTLFALSKHYAVPMDALLASNPSAKNGLSVGQPLLIPVKAQVKKELKTAPALMQGELAHTVAKKETLYGIARKYGVDQADLTSRNPSLAQGVKEGMIVVVPVGRVTTVPAAQIAPAVVDGSTLHLVQPGETIYSLSKRYGMEAEAIQAANGGGTGALRAGTYVRIPSKSTAVEALPGPETNTPIRPTGNSVSVAYLLPFSLADNDSLQARNREYKGLYGATDAAVQFWAGSRLAIDSLEKTGLRADVSVVDAGDDAKSWDPALKAEAVRNAQLCIGPFHRAAIEDLARGLPNTHIVCPAPQSNKVLLGNRNVSKVLSGRPDQLQQLARYVAYHHVKDNILICAPDIATEKDLREQMRSQLDRALDGKPGRVRDSVLVVKAGKREIGDLVTKLSSSQLNVVIAPTEDVEFVTALVGRLGEHVPAKRIVLFGTNAWLDMTTVELNDLIALDTHVPASTWVDRSDPRVQRFVRAYRDKFQNEPGEYAFLGFDVSFFYLSALQLFGNDMAAHFAEVSTQPLHTAFRLMRSGEENGFRNENAFMLHFTKEGLRKAP